VLENQFQIMNDWMKPILETSQANADGMQQLQQSVDSCLTSYNALIGDLESAEDDQPTPTPPPPPPPPVKPRKPASKRKKKGEG